MHFGAKYKQVTANFLVSSHHSPLQLYYNHQGISFYAFGFSWAENLSAQCMGYLGATLTQVFTRVRAERTCHSEMSQWPRWETRLASANDITHQKCAEDLEILKKSIS